MKIGVDLLGCDESYSGGVATFAIGITKGLAHGARASDTVVVFVSDKNKAYLEAALEGEPVVFEKVTLWSGRRYFLGVLKYLSWGLRNFRLIYGYEKIFRSGSARKVEAAADVLVVPTTTLGFSALRIPTILCMHDIQQEYFPEFFSFRERLSRWVTYRLSCWAATSIQVSSQFVRDCIVEKFHVNPNKFFIAYEGVDFGKFNLEKRDERPSAIDSIKDKKFVFYPAQLWQHKNHMLLLDALAQFRDRKGYEMPCVLTGQNYGYWEAIRERIEKLQLKQVTYLGRVSFDQLLWLYRNCSAVLALGLHESSSLPVREGAVFGKPLICSDIPPNIETQVFLSLNLVDQHTPGPLVDVFEAVDIGRADLVESARGNVERVKRFDWDVIAGDYLAVMAQWRKTDE